MRKIDASYRIMKVFKMLHQGPRSMDEIIEEFYREDICLNRETVSKYFKTLRKFGCDIEKKRHKFILKSVPFSLDLESGDFNNLAIFENLTTHLYGDSICTNLKSALKKILSLVDCTSGDIYHKHLLNSADVKEYSYAFREKINKLIKLGSQNTKIKILYDSKKKYISHITFRYCGREVYAHVFNEETKKYELLLLRNIEEMSSTPEYSFGSEFASTTVFQIRDRLKKSYCLHEGERVIKTDADSITISNNYEDKTQLLRRLVRYGSMCKIISSKNDVEQFKKMIDTMILNIDSIDERALF